MNPCGLYSFFYCPPVAENMLIHDFTSCLLHLLLLAELFVHSSSYPTHNFSFCGMFGSMKHQLDGLISSSKKLHDLTDEELVNFAAIEHRLDSLLHIQHTVTDFMSLKANESLSQLYVYTQSFRLHVDWLKTAKENVSLSSQSAESASTHLLQLSNLVNISLHQINADVPQSPSPSFPVVTTTFDALKFSVELSERLQVFCHWSKRVLRHLQNLSSCLRH
ncbi:uncharacterized protein [Brachyistius frenatus]|uniref:uncharacterized protein n=1 Tax=Brachyistius frenatus TaxID=100188 RepID=UPI0037E9C241